MGCTSAAATCRGQQGPLCSIIHASSPCRDRDTCTASQPDQASVPVQGFVYVLDASGKTKQGWPLQMGEVQAQVSCAV